jgi:hypothetical protein
VGRALVALGTTSPADEADAHLSGAVAILAASPARLDHAAALVELGAVRRRSGARNAAETALRDGLDLAARLGAGLLSSVPASSSSPWADAHGARRSQVSTP